MTTQHAFILAQLFYLFHVGTPTSPPSGLGYKGLNEGERHGHGKKMGKRGRGEGKRGEREKERGGESF